MPKQSVAAKPDKHWCVAGLRCGEYWTHKDLGLRYQKTEREKKQTLIEKYNAI